MVCLYVGVCLFVGHDREPCKNSLTDRDHTLEIGILTQVSPRNLESYETRSSKGKGTFEENIVDIFPRAVEQRSHSLAADAVGCHIKFYRVKNLLISSKFYEHLLDVATPLKRVMRGRARAPVQR